jgi:PhnB protein
MQVTPYFTFDGNCEAALHFYAQAFGGQIVHLSRFEDAPAESTTTQKQGVLHAQFASPKINFMASDGGDQNWKATVGNNMHLSIDFNDAADLETTFAALSDGANVTMPLQDTFWGARFGMLTDKFGINWMFNYDYKQ